jgi:hypothetical protein
MTLQFIGHKFFCFSVPTFATASPQIFHRDTRRYAVNVDHQVSDLGLLALTQLTQLTDLGLRRLYRLTDNSRTALTRFTALTRLNLGGCSRLTERTLIDVSPVLTRLTDLNLRGCDAVTDDGLASISSCSSLIRLDLKECDAVTEIGFHRFFRSSYVVPFLKALNLTRCASINDSCLLTMASHADALEELNLSGCRRITDVGVSALEDISSLHRVELKHCRKVSMPTWLHSINCDSAHDTLFIVHSIHKP